MHKSHVGDVESFQDSNKCNLGSSDSCLLFWDFVFVFQHFVKELKVIFTDELWLGIGEELGRIFSNIRVFEHILHDVSVSDTEGYNNWDSLSKFFAGNQQSEYEEEEDEFLEVGVFVILDVGLSVQVDMLFFIFRIVEAENIA